MKTFSLLRISALFGVLVTSGCSHNHQFDPDPRVATLPSSPLRGRTIYLDVTRIPEVYEASVEGSSFSILGVRTHGESVIRHLFAGERFTTDPQQSDVVLRGELVLDLGSAFGGTKCNARARWTILDRSSQSSGDGAGSSSVAAMVNGGNNCEIASLSAHAAALDAALAKRR